MKTLKDFIKESQEINEGLFGDIVRKLLDAGLSWIEGSVKWLADKSADAVGEVWKTHKDTVGTVYTDFRRDHPQYNFLPRTPKTAEEYTLSGISIFFNEDISADDKIDYANKLIKSLKKKTGKPGAVDYFIAQTTAGCYVGIVKNRKAAKSDKRKADEFLNAVKSSVNDDIKNLIDTNIKTYSSEL